MTEKEYYIVFFKSVMDSSIEIGFLPFYVIPERSVLKDAIFGMNDFLRIRDYGIEGIYEKYHLALEHFRLEKAWRKPNAEVWIQQIKVSPNYR